jgi:acyl-coenzyme A thioesterase PaaI-like protein
MMVGNWAQSILHGGVIASALDVAAGLVCVGSTLTCHDTINEEELRQRLSRMGTIDLRVDYLPWARRALYRHQQQPACRE